MKKTILFLLTSLFVASSSQVIANEISSFDSILAIIQSKRAVKDSNVITTTTIKEKKWFESFSIRGYAQVRYNNLLNTNEDLKCEQCDKSWGGDGGFFIRRMRIIFYGQLNERVYFYVQPDFASAAGTTNHIAQLRDAYFDIGFDKKNEFRLRIGQSKIPYGFENMQSSQNRLALDRNDALNSAVSNERDLGIFFYWAPEKRRKLFSSLVKDGLKGSGDYGCFAFGAYNGQTANQTDRNDQPHLATRFTWPFAVKTQIFETAIQAYAGNVGLLSTSSGVKKNATGQYRDQRVAATLVMYPKPFGFQAEYTIGLGPEFDKLSDSIMERELRGGYVLLNYQLKVKNQLIIPFVRGQYYEGGKKHELDARSYRVQEYEIGIEWQPNRNFELVAMYTFSKRRFEDYAKQDNFQEGSLLRLQAQVNF
jgi:phosphate-selective porin